MPLDTGNPRIALSRRARFTIFKRDDFTCQYCGRKPPVVVLEVDHVIAVADGGRNEEHNLVTSCFDCNRGKGRESLAVTPLDLSERARLLEEKQAQVRAYDRMLRKVKKEQDAAIQRIVAVYEGAFPDWTLSANARGSIGRFLERLPETTITIAMERAASRVDRYQCFRYFCGICWKMIKGPK